MKFVLPILILSMSIYSFADDLQSSLLKIQKISLKKVKPVRVAPLKKVKPVRVAPLTQKNSKLINVSSVQNREK